MRFQSEHYSIVIFFSRLLREDNNYHDLISVQFNAKREQERKSTIFRSMPNRLETARSNEKSLFFSYKNQFSKDFGLIILSKTDML